MLEQKNVKIGKMMREHDYNYQPWSKWGSGNMITFIHFTPKFQGTSIKYHATFKVLQPTYENEMDAWKYNEDSLKAPLKWGRSRGVCKKLKCCRCQQ